MKDINAVGDASAFPEELTPLGEGRAVFSADDGWRGRELWVTDGTPAVRREPACALRRSSGSLPQPSKGEVAA